MDACKFNTFKVLGHLNKNGLLFRCANISFTSAAEFGEKPFIGNVVNDALKMGGRPEAWETNIWKTVKKPQLKSARYDAFYYYMRNNGKCCKTQWGDISVSDKIFSIFLYTTEAIRRKLLTANDWGSQAGAPWSWGLQRASKLTFALEQESSKVSTEIFSAPHLLTFKHLSSLARAFLGALWQHIR